MEIGLNEMTTGYSSTGADELHTELYEKAIVETIKIIQDTTIIKNSLRAGWQGPAEETFEKNIDKTVEAAISALEDLGKSLDREFSQIQETWMNQEQNMVEEIQ